jgi:hypothetical protein
VLSVTIVFTLVWLYANTRGGTNIKNLMRPRRRH